MTYGEGSRISKGVFKEVEDIEELFMEVNITRYDVSKVLTYCSRKGDS
jgi:hypothetical protein